MVTSSISKLDALHELGRFEDLEQLAGQLIATDPDHLAAWVFMALARGHRNDLPGAVAAINTAIQLNPDLHQSWIIRSNLARRQKRYPDAVTAAREAIRLAPDQYQTHVTLAKSLRGSRKTIAAAATAATHAVELAPNAPETHLMVADVALRRGDLDTAETAVREALRLEPTSATLHSNLAIVRLQRRQVRAGLDAATGFAAALAVSPGEEGTRHRLAAAVYALAVRSWRAAAACLLLGLIAAVTLFNVMLDGQRYFNEPAHWATAVATCVLVTVPAGFVSWRLLRRIPARLRRGILRIGLAPAVTRIRLTGAALAVAVAIAQPLVPQVPIVVGGAIVLVVSVAAARLAGRPRRVHSSRSKRRISANDEK